jgi:hypothetical protein
MAEPRAAENVLWNTLLDIADTYHDMAEVPKRSDRFGSNKRCVLSDSTTGHNLKFVQEALKTEANYVSIINSETNKDVVLKDKAEKDQFVSLWKKHGVNDYEDMVTSIYQNVNKRESGSTTQLIEYKNKSTKKLSDYLPSSVNQVYLMMDALNGKAFYDTYMQHYKINVDKKEYHYISTIAQDWDPGTKWGQPPFQSIAESPGMIGNTQNHVKMGANKVYLKDKSINRQAVKAIDNSVKALCQSISLFAPDKKDAAIMRLLGVKQPNNAKRKQTDKCPIFDALHSYFAEADSQEKYANKCFHIKRSGDYGQIYACKRLNTTSTKPNTERYYLVTIDRLCYLRAKHENVPCILTHKEGTYVDICNGVYDDKQYKANLVEDLIKLVNSVDVQSILNKQSILPDAQQQRTPTSFEDSIIDFVGALSHEGADNHKHIMDKFDEIRRLAVKNINLFHQKLLLCQGNLKTKIDGLVSSMSTNSIPNMTTPELLESISLLEELHRIQSITYVSKEQTLVLSKQTLGSESITPEINYLDISIENATSEYDIVYNNVLSKFLQSELSDKRYSMMRLKGIKRTNDGTEVKATVFGLICSIYGPIHTMLGQLFRTGRLGQPRIASEISQYVTVFDQVVEDYLDELDNILDDMLKPFMPYMPDEGTSAQPSPQPSPQPSINGGGLGEEEGKKECSHVNIYAPCHTPKSEINVGTIVDELNNSTKQRPNGVECDDISEEEAYYLAAETIEQYINNDEFNLEADWYTNDDIYMIIWSFLACWIYATREYSFEHQQNTLQGILPIVFVHNCNVNVHILWQYVYDSLTCDPFKIRAIFFMRHVFIHFALQQPKVKEALEQFEVKETTNTVSALQAQPSEPEMTDENSTSLELAIQQCKENARDMFNDYQSITQAKYHEALFHEGLVYFLIPNDGHHGGKTQSTSFLKGSLDTVNPSQKIKPVNNKKHYESVSKRVSKGQVYYKSTVTVRMMLWRRSIRKKLIGLALKDKSR